MYKRLFFIFIFFLFLSPGFAQDDRFQQLEQRLKDLTAVTPGLNEKVDFSVSGASIQEFLRGLAESNNLNISIDPSLNFKIYNNFTNETVSNIILFLAKEYDLDVRFVGSIMSFSKFNTPVEITKYIPKEIKVKYNNYNDLISLDLNNDTLTEVARKITQESKKNIILSSGIGVKAVSVYIEDMPFESAMEKMAYANNLKLTKTSDNFYLLQSLREGEELVIEDPNANGKKPGRRGSLNKYASRKNGADQNGSNLAFEVLDSLGKFYISLEALNAPIQDIVKAVAEEAGISYFIFSDLKGNTTTNVNKVLFSEFLTYVLQGSDYTYKVDQGLYLIGERKLEGLRANKVYQFQYRSLDAINDIIPAELKKGVEIKEFKELNSILLTGSSPQINEIVAFIRQLDKVVPMVMIEVILMDVRKGKSIKTGIKAGISDSIKTGGSLFPGLDFTFNSKSINNLLSTVQQAQGNPFNIGRVTPNFYVSLSAMEKNENVEVRSMPKLSTLNGHDANLSIGSTRYYSLSTQNVLGTLNPQTVVTQQFNSVTANLAINIKPIVSGDDQVTLNIDVNISDFIGDAPAMGPPPTSNSQFKSIVRVRNEEMVVLGGLERIEKSDGGTGVPILSRIPVLKWFFSSRSKSKNKTVSIVFIKPTIIY